MRCKIFRLLTIGPAIRAACFGVTFLTPLSASVFANEVDPFSPHQCPYVRCADYSSSRTDTEVQPIRLFGATVSVDNPEVGPNIKRHYFSSMREFPNLEFCLDSSDPATQLLTEAKMRWRDLGSQFAASVCVFRLFDAMRDPTLAAGWLSDNGFFYVRNLPGNRASSFHYSDGIRSADEVRVVSAYWPTSENGRLFRSVLAALLEKVFSRGVIINAVFDKGGNVLLISIEPNPRFPL